MNDSARLLFEDAVASLVRRSSEAEDCTESDRACIAWALNDKEPLRGLAETASSRLREARSYQSVATLGFALHSGDAGEGCEGDFCAGLDWLCGRSDTIAGETASFVTDAVALLGVAAGAITLGDEARSKARSWMSDFATHASSLPAVEEWKRCILASALCELEGVTSIPTELETADVRVALSKLLSRLDALEDDERAVLELVRDPAAQLHPVHASLRLAALRWVQRSAPIAIPNRLEPHDLVGVLDRVPAGLRRWAWETKARTRGGTARKWYVDHEYHVQDLLYFLLAPLLPGLKDEEYFPSLGQKQPRADLFVPSMRLIIEVKFLRSNDKFTKIIDEIASDTSLYLKDGSDYTGLIAFVWDDSRRTEEHAMLIDGLTDIRGVLDAVVVPRPGRMVEDVHR